MNDRLLCQKKQDLRRGNGRVVSPVLTYMGVPNIFLSGKRTTREAIDLQRNAGLGNGLRIREIWELSAQVLLPTIVLPEISSGNS